MKNALLASVAFLFVSTSAFAAMPSIDLETGLAPVAQNDLLLLAKKGSDGGGDDNGGDNDNDNDNDNDDNDSNDNDDDSNDDNGGDRDDDASDDSNDDSPLSNSNRRKKRIPGGSGCDGAGDVAEHPSCSPQ
jgi:hypothetical protein